MENSSCIKIYIVGSKLIENTGGLKGTCMFRNADYTIGASLPNYVVLGSTLPCKYSFTQIGNMPIKHNKSDRDLPLITVIN